MTAQDFSTRLVVDRTPEQAASGWPAVTGCFAAVNSSPRCGYCDTWIALRTTG